MDPAWKKELSVLLVSVRDEQETASLLEALLTPGEYDELARRWQIVKGLMEGKPQRTIKDNVAVSIATVSRGSRELQYGNGIFQKLYSRLKPKRSIPLSS